MNPLKCFWYKLVWILGMLFIFSGTGFSSPGLDHSFVHSRYPLFFPEVWIMGGLSYFPFHIQPLPIYPKLPGAYPCFLFSSCMVLQPYRKYERRGKPLKPEPVFKRGEPLVDEAMEAWRAGLQPSAEPFRTDERQIVPTFRGHSLIRSEYREAGSVLPDFSLPVLNNFSEEGADDGP